MHACATLPYMTTPVPLRPMPPLSALSRARVGADPHLGGRLPSWAPRGAFALPDGRVELPDGSIVAPDAPPAAQVPRSRAWLARLGLTLAVSVVLLACGAQNPVAPSTGRQMADVWTGDPEIDAALAIIDADTTPAGWTGGASVRDWFLAQPFVAIVKWDDPSGNIAHYDHNTRTIWYSGYRPAIPPAGNASTLIHEARHAQGFLHSCGVLDRAYDGSSPWSVTIDALDRYGRHAHANVLRPWAFCEP